MGGFGLAEYARELFRGQVSESVLETQVELLLMGKGEEVVQDYAAVGLSLKAHQVSFVRSQLDMLNIRTCHHINNDSTDGRLVNVAGLVLVRQRPGTAGGVCFITIKDETAILIWWYLRNCSRPIEKKSCILAADGGRPFAA